MILPGFVPNIAMLCQCGFS